MNEIKHNNYKPISFPKVEIVEKVWGREEILINEDFCGKLLVFKKGTVLSLHSHISKKELFYLTNGKAIFRYHDYDEVKLKERELNPGDSVLIPQFNFHSVEALEDSTIIEISSHHEDSDSFRLIKSKSHLNIK